MEDAVSVEADAPAALAKLLPVAAAVSDLPPVTLPDTLIARLRQGQGVPANATGEGAVAVFDSGGRLVAVARYDAANRLLQPEKVFARE